ncbi:MAG: adenylate/guanylate cyclase domain-containing protein [Candidatus Tectimicrobiota bacterium]|nr:MAG: adenylate/guanylate cyclase domain-containing protein [Candidatus Tectomicrobia bacterium]
MRSPSLAARWWPTAATVRRLRLASGLMLFTFVLTHLLNHALGLVSLAAMEAGRRLFLALWRHPLGTLALYGALLLHLGLALWALYQRRRLRMPWGEALQLGCGLLIPLLLTTHVVGTRLAHAWFEVNDTYAYVVAALWLARPDLGVQQALVLLLAWVHGSTGLYFWLRLKPWHARLAPLLFAAALLVPVLALLGFVQAGRELAIRARDPAWVQAMLREARAPQAAARQQLNRARQIIPAAFGLAVALTLGARGVRQRRERRRGTVEITYPGGRRVVVPLGFSVLEASRQAGIAHASVCGGRGRCSTCRVRVTHGAQALPPPSPAEQRVLARLGVPATVRLACQLRPRQALGVVPLLPPEVSPRAGVASPRYAAGEERELAVLFADLRGFTRLAEPKLPYDVVFFLNRYFAAIGEAVRGTGGLVNQFTGDGVMALFGIEQGEAEGCRQALRAASAMLRSLEALSQTLAEELPAPLRMGIGVHSGPAVVGRMGYAEATYLTAVGDTVHVASRLEELTKTYDCPLILSERVAQQAQLEVAAYPCHEIAVRNREEPLRIYVIYDVHALAARLVGRDPGMPER